MKNILIAKRYASAAIHSLKESDYQKILNQLKAFKRVFKDNPELKKFFASTIIQKDKKIKFLSSITEDLENKDYWNQLISVIIIKNRGIILDIFFVEFEKLLNSHLNQKNVNIVLAHEQDDETLDLIRREIERTLDCKVVFDVEVNKEIIGGFIAHTDSQLIDASIKSNLTKFTKTISKSYN